MKLIILKNNLLEGLNILERAIGDNINLPILKNVLLKTGDNKIFLIATNLELATSCVVSGKTIENGEVTVPHHIFYEIVKNLSTERITLENKNKDLIVTTDNYEALIQGQNPKEFPIIPSIRNSENFIRVPTDVFQNALSKVAVAAQFSDIRPEISGVLLSYANQVLTLVATDSFRLIEKKFELDQTQSNLEETTIIIPLKTVGELLRILKKEEEISIYINANQVLFKTTNLEIISHLIDGRFPEYQAIIPKQIQNEAVLSRAEFITAVKLTSAFSGRLNDINVKVGDNKKFLEIYCFSNTLGENRYRVPIKLKGDKFAIAFNWRYLLDGLRIYEGEEVILGVNGNDRAVVVKTQDETGLIYILMPIKT